MSFIKFCLLVAITIAGIKCKNTANWLEDIWLSFLLTVVLIFFFIFPAVHTSATRSVGKTRLGYHWLGRRASSGACQMKVLRNRDNQRTLQGKGSGQFDRLSALFVFNLYCILFIDCIIFLSSLTPINCVSDKPGASLYWSRSQLIGSPEFVPTTPAQVLCW